MVPPMTASRLAILATCLLATLFPAALAAASPANGPGSAPAGPAREQAVAGARCAPLGAAAERRCRRAAALRSCARLRTGARRAACRSRVRARFAPVRVAAPPDPAIADPPALTASGRGFTTQANATTATSPLVPPGGVLTACDGPDAQRLSAIVDVRRVRFGTGVRFAWLLDGTEVLTSAVKYPPAGAGEAAEGFTLPYPLPGGTWTFVVRTRDGAELTRASVSRPCDPIAVLGFASFPLGPYPETPPADLTPPGGTITGCSGDRLLVAYWRERVMPGLTYLFVALDPSGELAAGGAPDSLSPAGAVRNAYAYTADSGGNPVQLADGVWAWGWRIAEDAPIIPAAVRVSC